MCVCDLDRVVETFNCRIVLCSSPRSVNRIAPRNISQPPIGSPGECSSLLSRLLVLLGSGGFESCALFQCEPNPCWTLTLNQSNSLMLFLFIYFLFPCNAHMVRTAHHISKYSSE